MFTVRTHQDDKVELNKLIEQFKVENLIASVNTHQELQVFSVLSMVLVLSGLEDLDTNSLLSSSRNKLALKRICVADPATPQASDRVLGPDVPLRTARLFTESVL